MSEEIELPSEEELSKLPRVSIVVYALRCALRVQPVWTLWNKPTAEYKRAIVKLNTAYKILVYNASSAAVAAETAVAAEAAASERAAYAAAYAAAAYDRDAVAAEASAAARAARAAAYAATSATATAAADEAAYAAEASATAATATAATAARADYARLLESKTEVTDASETGPLGDLWHGSPPDWYLEAKAKYDKTIAEWEREFAEKERNELAKQIEESDPEPLISAYFDRGFTKEEISTCLLFLSEAYRSIGGRVGLKIVEGNEFSYKTEGVLSNDQ